MLHILVSLFILVSVAHLADSGHRGEVCIGHRGLRACSCTHHSSRNVTVSCKLQNLTDLVWFIRSPKEVRKL